MFGLEGIGVAMANAQNLSAYNQGLGNQYPQQQMQQPRHTHSTYRGYALEHDYRSDCYKIKVGNQMFLVPDHVIRTGDFSSLDQLIDKALSSITVSNAVIFKAAEDVKVADIQTIPDVSLTRVLKWAVVLLVAMGLGKRVWALFGDKITAQVHKAIGEGV